MSGSGVPALLCWCQTHPGRTPWLCPVTLHLALPASSSRGIHTTLLSTTVSHAGGPGCSSEIAIFYENGPYSLAKNFSLVDNPYGWDVNANVIYVDQPINTGFSWSDVSSASFCATHIRPNQAPSSSPSTRPLGQHAEMHAMAAVVCVIPNLEV